MRDLQMYITAHYAPHQREPRFVLNAQPFQRAVDNLKRTSKGYELYDKAQQLEKRGNIFLAIATYLEAATAASDQLLILAGLGLVYLRGRDMGAARQHLARAV